MTRILTASLNSIFSLASRSSAPSMFHAGRSPVSPVSSTRTRTLSVRASLLTPSSSTTTRVSGPTARGSLRNGGPSTVCPGVGYCSNV